MAQKIVTVCDGCGREIDANIPRFFPKNGQVMWGGAVFSGADICPSCEDVIKSLFKAGIDIHPMTKEEEALWFPPEYFGERGKTTNV